MTNPHFDRIEDYRDVESLNQYQILKAKGKSHAEIMEILKQKSRDNSRTPMQWNSEAHSGFTTGTPWIAAAGNYKKINVEQALKDKQSIFYHYQKLIQLRKTCDLITYGDYQLILPDHPQIFAYIRNGKDEKLLVVNNFYGKPVQFKWPEEIEANFSQTKMLISNYPDAPQDFRAFTLRPYESVVYHLTK